MARRQFTLFELIVVMTLVATMVAIAAPNLRMFIRGRSVVEDARRLLAATRAAGSVSVSRGVPVTLWVEPQNSRFELVSWSGEDDAFARIAAHTVSDTVRLRIETHSGTDNTENRYSVVWTPDGILDTGDLRAIVVEDRYATDARVVFAPDEFRTRFVEQPDVGGDRP